VEFVLQACVAVAEAHGLGIVHRDLKPANLFCIRRADGLLAIKVLDFGISKLTALGSDKEMTRTTAILGSPYYMSPEQIQASRGVDTRTDIWSLGVILFELVTGRVPFDAEAVTELVVKIATSPAPPIRSLRADLPPGFDHVVTQCMEKDRERRMQSVADLAIALRDYAPKRARGSVERVLRTMQAAGLSQAVLPPSGSFRAAYERGGGAAHVTDPTWGQTGEGSKKSKAGPVLALSAGVVVLLAAAGGGLLMMRGHPSPTVAPASTESAAVASPSLATPETLTPLPALAPPAPTPVEGAAAAPSVTVATPAASRAPSSSVAPRRGGTSPAPHVSPTATPAANCSPPFTIDASGHRVPKPECM
ncbi:MAG TPA: protein kinase, partial [Polyangiaceae bacterium]